MDGRSRRLDGPGWTQVPAHLVLDLAGVRFLASAGLGLILSAMRNGEDIRGRLHLLGVRGNCPVTRVLDLTGLPPPLDIHDSLDELLDPPRPGAYRPGATAHVS